MAKATEHSAWGNYLHADAVMLEIIASRGRREGRMPPSALPVRRLVLLGWSYYLSLLSLQVYCGILRYLVT